MTSVFDTNDKMAIFDLVKRMQEDNDYSDNESEIGSEDSYDEYVEDKCKHIHTIERNGSIVCTNCGNVLSSRLYDHEAYAEGGGTSRHHHRKFEEKGIMKELENYPIPKHIKIAADEEYHNQVDNRIKRGQNRQSIIFACVYRAYQSQEPKNPHLIAEQLNTKKKAMSRGVKYYHNIINREKMQPREVDCDNSRNIDLLTQHSILDHLLEGHDPLKLTNLSFREKEIRQNNNRDSAETIDLIKNYIEIIKKEKDIEIDEEEAIALYKHILNNFLAEDYIGDKHNAKSLTAGVIYYILKKTHHLTKKEFKNIVKISEITITKVVKEITDLMAKNNINSV